MSNIIFIETKNEARLAAEAANQHFEGEFNPDDFYKCYTHNVVNYLPNGSDKHAALKDIADAVIAHRAEKEAARKYNWRTDIDKRLDKINDPAVREDKFKEAVALGVMHYGIPESAIRWSDYDLDRFSVSGLVLEIHAEWLNERS